jgi:hypothetical protein
MWTSKTLYTIHIRNKKTRFPTHRKLCLHLLHDRYCDVPYCRVLLLRSYHLVMHTNRAAISLMERRETRELTLVNPSHYTAPSAMVLWLLHIARRNKMFIFSYRITLNFSDFNQTRIFKTDFNKSPEYKSSKKSIYRCADEFLARPTSRCILFDWWLEYFFCC